MGTCMRMLSVLRISPLQLRTSGPCPCLEGSMEEQDEKPPGPLKACVQVSGTSLPLFGRPRAFTHRCPTAQSLGGCPSILCNVLGAFGPPDRQNSIHRTFYEALCTSSPSNPGNSFWEKFGILYQKPRFSCGQHLTAGLKMSNWKEYLRMCNARGERNGLW